MPDTSEIMRTLGRLEAKVDLLIEAHPELDTRVRKLESRQSWMLGGGAVIGALLTFVGSHLSFPWSYFK